MATIKAFIKQHAALTYFVLTLAIATGGIHITIGREGVPLKILESPLTALD